MGSHADIQAAKSRTCGIFLSCTTRPTTRSLAIVGDFDPRTRRNWSRSIWAAEAWSSCAEDRSDNAADYCGRRAVIHDQVEYRVFMEAWLTSPIFKRGDAPADLFLDILGGGKSSRLYKKLVYEKQIALDVTASQNR